MNKTPTASTLLETYDVEFLRVIVGTAETTIGVILPSVLEWSFQILLVLSTCIFWYYLFWRPLDRKKDLTEFGFAEASRQYAGGRGNDAQKRSYINFLRRQRKVGDVPPIYANGWFAILESRDLRKTQVREITCLGVNLVAWRGENETAYVTDAYCPHIGANLGVFGEVVNGNCIKCPFHGWEFEGVGGKCVKVPYSTNVPEFAKLKVWKTVEMNGTLYLWYHAEGESPSYLPDEFPHIGSGKWVFRGRSQHIINCHPQELSENGSDLHHLNIVHTPSTLEGGCPKESWLKVPFLQHLWTGDWTPSSDPKTPHRALMTVGHKMSIFGRLTTMEVHVQAHQVGPGTVFLHYKGLGGEGVLLFGILPIEPMVVRVAQAFYSSRSMLHPFGLLVLLSQAVQLERDISIWNRKTYLRAPSLLKEDRTLATFRRWYGQFYSKHSPRLQDDDRKKKQTDLGSTELL